MRTRSIGVILCLVVFAVLPGGCRKKSPRPDQDQSEPVTQSVEVPAVPVVDVARQFAIDQGSSVAEISAAAKEMTADNLRKMAEKYRDLVAANQQKLTTLTEQYVAVPLTEKNTPQAEALKAAIDEVYKGLPLIKDRYKAYYDALKEKAGNLAGLDI
jgi:hypothetical protein